jgi:hypothetical protein
MNSNDKLVYLTLTELGARNLVQVLDLAVKAGGLNTAFMCIEIAQVIESQLYPKDTSPVKNQEPIDEQEQKEAPSKQEKKK